MAHLPARLPVSLMEKVTMVRIGGRKLPLYTVGKSGEAVHNSRTMTDEPEQIQRHVDPPLK